MVKKLCTAIRSRTIIRFNYKDKYCLVEPISYGIDSEGKGVLKGYQVAGSSDDNTVTGLKYFKEVHMSDVEQTRHKYRKNRNISSHSDVSIKWICCTDEKNGQ